MGMITAEMLKSRLGGIKVASVELPGNLGTMCFREGSLDEKLEAQKRLVQGEIATEETDQFAQEISRLREEGKPLSKDQQVMAVEREREILEFSRWVIAQFACDEAGIDLFPDKEAGQAWLVSQGDWVVTILDDVLKAVNILEEQAAPNPEGAQMPPSPLMNGSDVNSPTPSASLISTP